MAPARPRRLWPRRLKPALASKAKRPTADAPEYASSTDARTRGRQGIWLGTSAATKFRMSRVRRQGTEPELKIKRVLRDLNVHFREDDRDLPGRPDFVLPQVGAVVRFHGCFWHGHACARGRLPRNNRSLWREKLRRNQRRDQVTARRLRALGWRVLTLWECRLGIFNAEAFASKLQTAPRR